ncbi:MAG: membrane protein insertase YidC [Mycoplasma sp.]|nr:membrane protein insertase YidC [Mycoplasma sp.]
MGNQPAFKYNSLVNKTSFDNTSSPFWVKPKNKFSKTKTIFRQIWKWSKILILLFFFVIGLWGCFQTSFDPKVSTNTNIGSGLEFGFVFGTTGNFLYDLFSSPGQEFHSFSNWSMDYGPFYGLFVWVGAWLTLQLTWVTHNAWGGLNALLGIFILILIIRVFTTLITIKSTLQNEKMSEINAKMSEINAKYKDAKDTQSKQMKQQEIMELYKKNNVRPFAAFEQILITLPIFLIVYRVVTILRPLKGAVLFNVWSLASAPLTTLFSNFKNGGWTYMFFILIVVPVQFLSTWLPQRLAKRRNHTTKVLTQKGAKDFKKRTIFQYLFAGAMSLIVVFTPCGVGVYWFFNACFAILQSYIMHRIIIAQKNRKFKQNIGNISII